MEINIDFTATIVELAGLAVPESMQGQSLLPIIRDPKVEGRKEWYYLHNVSTASQGTPLPNCEGVRTERWKYIHYKDTDPVQEELFDLKDDPREQKNSSSNPEYGLVLKDLRSRCVALREIR